MAAGKFKTYEKTLEYLKDGCFTGTANYKMALFTSSSNANTLSLANARYGDLTNEVANANGYTTGGVALTNVSWGLSGNVLTFDFDPAVWTASGGSITTRFIVVYLDATVAGVVQPCLCICLAENPSADVTVTTGNTLTVTPNASGVATITGANVD